MHESTVVLAVDDQPSILSVLAKVFMPPRYHLACAGSFAEAAQWAAAQEFHVALLDKNLAGESGLQLIPALRERNPHTECLVMTAYGTLESAQECIRLGVFDYLTKPFKDLEQLRHMVDRAAERFRMRRERDALVAELAASDQRYALAVEGARDGLWDWDLAGGTIYLAPRWKGMRGYEDGELRNDVSTWFDAVHPDDLVSLRESIDALLVGGEAHLVVDYRMRHRDGSYRWMQARAVCVRDPSGVAQRLVGSQTDVSDQRCLEESLRFGMLHDQLTKRPNKTYMLQALDHLLLRDEPSYSLAVFEVEGVRRIGEAVSPKAADDALRQVAQRCGDLLGRRDLLARWDGCCFAVLMEGEGASERCGEFLQQVRSALNLPIVIGGHRVTLATSVGVVHSGRPYLAGEQVIRDGLVALARAKHARGSGRAVHNPAMSRHAQETFVVDSELRAGLERREIEMVFMPLVVPGRGVPRGFEALMRWNHPSHGVRLPKHFLNVAEETGLIVPLGLHALRLSLDALDSLRERFGDVYVTVNISGLQLAQGDFADAVARALEESGHPAGELVLELTETVLIHQDDGLSRANLKKLHDMGVRLSLDDFGTGYSSLRYLFDFPWSFLKIDRSFVGSLLSDHRHEAVIGGLVELGHTLNVAVVAEGAECSGQVRMLEALGCDLLQGLVFGSPAPAASLAEEANARMALSRGQREVSDRRTVS